VFVVTKVLGEIVAANGVERERITVIHNGVHRGRFALQRYTARPRSSIVVGFVGFVRDWHGLDAVITGLASERVDPPIRLVVVGPGCAKLIDQAQALGVRELVEFTGLRQREAIPEVIRAFDIALQARAVAYASPLKLFEYMACGRAIVAPDQPNIREILTNGENALLFDPEKPAALWHAIQRLAADPELRERLGRAARETLDARDYTWEGNAGRVTDSVLADLNQRGIAVTDVTSPSRFLSRG
jgi:glycosyltransferase involved in cell wall biosynthesis